MENVAPEPRTSGTPRPLGDLRTNAAASDKPSTPRLNADPAQPTLYAMQRTLHRNPTCLGLYAGGSAIHDRHAKATHKTTHHTGSRNGAQTPRSASATAGRNVTAATDSKPVAQRVPSSTRRPASPIAMRGRAQDDPLSKRPPATHHEIRARRPGVEAQAKKADQSAATSTASSASVDRRSLRSLSPQPGAVGLLSRQVGARSAVTVSPSTEPSPSPIPMDPAAISTSSINMTDSTGTQTLSSGAGKEDEVRLTMIVAEESQCRAEIHAAQSESLMFINKLCCRSYTWCWRSQVEGEQRNAHAVAMEAAHRRGAAALTKLHSESLELAREVQNSSMLTLNLAALTAVVDAESICRRQLEAIAMEDATGPAYLTGEKEALLRKFWADRMPSMPMHMVPAGSSAFASRRSASSVSTASSSLSAAPSKLRSLLTSQHVSAEPPSPDHGRSSAPEQTFSSERTSASPTIGDSREVLEDSREPSEEFRMPSVSSSGTAIVLPSLSASVSPPRLPDSGPSLLVQQLQKELDRVKREHSASTRSVLTQLVRREADLVEARRLIAEQQRQLASRSTETSRAPAASCGKPPLAGQVVAEDVASLRSDRDQAMTMLGDTQSALREAHGEQGSLQRRIQSLLLEETRSQKTIRMLEAAVREQRTASSQQ